MITYKDVVARSKKKTDICEHLLRLYKLTINIPFKEKVVVELGVRGGESTTALLAAVNDSGGHLYSVDIVCCRSLFRNELNWSFIHGDDLEIVELWIKEIDHLFIDTNHHFEHTLSELREWDKLIKSPGIITLHDTNTPSYPGVMKAIRIFLKENPEYEFKNYPECFGLGVIRK